LSPDAAVLVPLWLTLKVALFATVLAGAAGVALGWWMSRRRFTGHGFVDAVLMVPMVLPPTVLGYYLIVVIGRNGVLGRHLQNWFGINLMFTWQGAVIAAAFEEVDGRFALAARTMGAGELEIFARIALPLAVRGIASGLMLAFARAMGEFGATLMIAGNLPGKTQTLSIAVYDAVQAGEDAQALWLTLVISAVCIGVLVASGRLLRARH
jgi:molybdate transport system permease protein